MREDCIKCGSCSSIAPVIFQVLDDGVRIARQPSNKIESRLAQAALINCPTRAIRQHRTADASIEDVDQIAASLNRTEHKESNDLVGESIYYRLFDEAEKARWRMNDIPWSEIDKNRVTDRTLKLVREVVFSELTTFSASERFFKDFADDVDFTQWVAVWLYEETKHPHVLMRWLKHFGETFSTDFMLQGRETYPLMKSRMGTLVMNIISEMMASAGYLSLDRHAAEPVLKLIARNLASDEARHASSFYSYAHKLLARSASPDEEKLHALQVLYFWLTKSQQVKHPINQFFHRISDDAVLADSVEKAGFDSGAQHNRVCEMVGTLIGRPLRTKREIGASLMEFSTLVGRQRNSRTNS